MALPAVRTKYASMGGGLDLTTPAMSVRPGYCLEALNFEPAVSGGYRRIAGYERFDGRAKPSDAVYWTVPVLDSSGFTVGETIDDGGTATAVFLAAGDATTLVVTDLQGTGFSDGSTVSGATSGATTTTTGGPEQNGADLAEDDATYTALAADHYRQFIQAVPGSGPVRGVWRHEGTTYAFRDNAGATACVLHKASASGWQPVAMKHVLRFLNGTMAEGEIVEGATTIDGLTSGASATVLKIVKHSGSWGNDAIGYFLLDTPTGTFTDGENLQVGGTTKADADGASYQHSFAPGGRFEWVSHNFYSQEETFRVYGCDGVNPAFEIDENELVTPVLLPDLAGAPAQNNPKYIEVFQGHLFLGFSGGSVQHSVPGEPLVVDGFLGSAEFGLGAEVTGFQAEAGNVLLCFTRRQTFGLYGNNITDWNLRPVSPKTGALPYTVQRTGQTLTWDDRGIVSLSRTDAFGDFADSALSQRIKPLVDERKSGVVASTVVRASTQVRYYSTSGDFLIGYMKSNGGMDFMPGRYPVTVRCICNADDENGAETILFGSDDGYVYQAERGTSFDGEPIEYALRLAFNHLGSPHLRKSFKKMDLELDTENYVLFSLATELSYAAAHTASNANQSQSVGAYSGGAYWDNSEWNQFFWSDEPVATAQADVTGTGTNLGILAYGNSDSQKPFTLQGFLVHYIPRRRNRG